MDNFNRADPQITGEQPHPDFAPAPNVMETYLAYSSAVLADWDEYANRSTHNRRVAAVAKQICPDHPETLVIHMPQPALCGAPTLTTNRIMPAWAAHWALAEQMIEAVDAGTNLMPDGDFNELETRIRNHTAANARETPDHLDAGVPSLHDPEQSTPAPAGRGGTRTIVNNTDKPIFSARAGVTIPPHSSYQLDDPGTPASNAKPTEEEDSEDIAYVAEAHADDDRVESSPADVPQDVQ